MAPELRIRFTLQRVDISQIPPRHLVRSEVFSQISAQTKRMIEDAIGVPEILLSISNDDYCIDYHTLARCTVDKSDTFIIAGMSKIYYDLEKLMPCSERERYCCESWQLHKKCDRSCAMAKHYTHYDDVCYDCKRPLALFLYREEIVSVFNYPWDKRWRLVPGQERKELCPICAARRGWKDKEEEERKLLYKRLRANIKWWEKHHDEISAGDKGGEGDAVA